MTPALQTLPLTCLVLLLLQNSPGVGAQSYTDFKLLQPQGPVVVTTGETLTLNCTVSGWGPVGPMKWLKGWGDGNEIIYSQKGSFPPRVMRVVEESSTDFTIRITNVRIEDAGTYYCVKFRKDTFGDVFFQHGEGTEVLVQTLRAGHVRAEPPRVPGQSVPFTCSTRGFFPHDIQLEWLKNGTPVQAEPPLISPEMPNSSYHVSSTMQVTLREIDIRSELTCKVQHTTLAAPLTRTYALGRALRVPPSVSVAAAPPGAVEANKTVNFTCRVQGFYPGAVSVSWLENGTEMNAGSTPQPTETSRGLFELKSTVTVQAGEEKNGSRFTCRVLHEDQEPIFSTGTLRVDPSDGSTGDSSA
ncbi:hypothetical protein ASZ78_005516 [Callipepla squamata]|uniref:Ig-like domain-containing protein n=1 Tax=Callipepla squamata TaxID=9009 RepID=A0A226NJZ2_CALSU|nr:hypothetical protein ASZ78_005516 [Callipepla squamata]